MLVVFALKNMGIVLMSFETSLVESEDKYTYDLECEIKWKP